jgi:hypothetical protein
MDQLTLALDYRTLRRYIEYPNYREYCRGLCKDFDGFYFEVLQENTTGKKEAEFMEDIIIPDIKKKLDGKEFREKKVIKQREFFLDMLEDFGEQKKYNAEKAKCMSFIISSISDPIRDKIKGEETPFELISRLRDLCPSSSLGQVINLKKQIYHAVMERENY